MGVWCCPGKMILPDNSVLLLLLCSVGLSTQCASKVENNDQGIRSARLVQLPEDTPTNNILEQTQGVSGDITNHVEVKVADIENMLDRAGKQISQGIVKACPKIFKTENRFYQSVVREQVVAQDVDDCAIKCKQASYCRSFAFSSSENVNENCDLSELSTQNIDAEKELKEDSNWGVYGVAEDDSCEDDQEETTTKKEEPKNCKCNGFIDTVGGGECRQQLFGNWWCYVDKDNDCPDSQDDSSMPVFSRSYQACQQGPCECNKFNLRRYSIQDICMTDIFDDSKFCYVPLESRCKDKRQSKIYPSVYWSLEACSDGNDTNDNNEEGSGEDATTLAPQVEEENVSFHRTWNFNSSFVQCANYCANSERCQYMHSKYDADEGICHLSTKPFYVVTYLHNGYGHGHGHHLGGWIKK